MWAKICLSGILGTAVMFITAAIEVALDIDGGDTSDFIKGAVTMVCVVVTIVGAFMWIWS